MPYRVTTANIDFRLNLEKWTNIINDLKGRSDVILIQEAKNVNLHQFADDVWSVHQNTANANKRGSAVMWKKSIGAFHGKGIEPLVAQRRGIKMGSRFIAWVDIYVPEFGFVVRFTALHYPPGRFRRLWPIANKSVRRFIANTRRQKKVPVVGADFNSQVGRDVHRMRRTTKVQVTGRKIDGFLIGGRLRHTPAVGLGNNASDHDPRQTTISRR